MRTIPHHPTIYPAILSSFTAQGLTRQEALAQPRRAEVILRHDPFAALPYIVTLSAPSFAFEGSGTPMHGDHAWDFATFNEALAWFDELFEANTDIIVERQRPPKREPHDGTVPWKVGDAAILSHLVPYDVWLARTQSRRGVAAAFLQAPLRSKRNKCEDPEQKKRSHKCGGRSTTSKHRGTVPVPTPLRHITVVRPLSIFELASKCESFFSFGNF